ncbi:prolyl aminopeptidase [Pseudanabaena sp. UWO311]|uniref:prolyl aminopeptidase n=1 Tax=Pseudanabaena sp. UWO311 TaxID=2487337 RepID=UPI00115B17A3|nr:prolyl aminopeptidase [Pseudanabaena sp. UWO311]TYQ27859.1 prolyl aminopeptidase [Pseudanabaena sp. UWO311]
MRELYTAIEPYRQGLLKVSNLHTIYFEESGNPQGKPVVILHGGPGGGSQPIYRQYFNPNLWRIVQFDQRGCGKSTPHAELSENTTWHLVEDIETLRKHLNINDWVISGGSWGSTLALAYSQTHPQYCQALILRGIFMLRRKELAWFYQEGAGYFFPEAWEQYVEIIPKVERHDMIAAYYRRLISDDQHLRSRAARTWSIWEASTSKLIPDLDLIARFGTEDFADAFARLECHYFINKGFFMSEMQLLENVDRIRHIPTTIVQGRYDVVCPMFTAWELHQAFPEAEFIVVPDAGHSMMEVGIRSVLIEASDRLSK